MTEANECNSASRKVSVAVEQDTARLLECVHKRLQLAAESGCKGIRSLSNMRRGERPMRLGQVFDPRANALNAWRLVLASGVILWHSFPLTGRMPWAPFVQLLGGCAP